MPAYGKNLSPPEIEALVAFLETLHPANESPAVDAAQQAIAAAEATAAAETQGKAAASPNAGP